VSAAKPPVPLSAAPDLIGRFLVEQALYSSFELHLEEPVSTKSRFYPEVVRRPCKSCRVETNWTYRGALSRGVTALPGNLPVRGTGLALNTHEGGDLLSYKCVQCDSNTFALWIDVRWPGEEATYRVDLGRGPYGGTRVPSGAKGVRMVSRKLGQWPPYSIRPSSEVASALELGDLKLYERALMNLSTGYGIGAMAYLRRVVENEVVRILGSLKETAEKDGDDALAEQIAKAQQARSAEERLKLAGEAAPSWLRAGGHNFLSLLYGHFSRGIHELDDAACLELAQRLRAAFEAVLTAIRSHREQQAAIAGVLT